MDIRTPKLVHDCSVNYELTLCSRHRLSLRTLRTITVLSVSLLLHTGKIQIFPLLPSHHIIIPFSSLVHHRLPPRHQINLLCRNG